MIALLLDREFNHSQKCLEVPIREIYGVYSIIWKLRDLHGIYWGYMAVMGFYVARFFEIFEILVLPSRKRHVGPSAYRDNRLA